MRSTKISASADVSKTASSRNREEVARERIDKIRSGEMTHLKSSFEAHLAMKKKEWEDRGGNP